MGSAYPSSHLISPLSIFLAVFFILSNTPCEAQLSPSFYNKTCPNALSTIRSAVNELTKDPGMAAALIRLHFHDCFVQVMFMNSKSPHSVICFFSFFLYFRFPFSKPEPLIECRAVMLQFCLTIPPPFKVRNMRPRMDFSVMRSKP